VLEAGRVLYTGSSGPKLDHVALTQLKNRPQLINLLRIDDVSHVGDHWQGTLGAQVLHLPEAAASHAGKSAHIQFLPRDVTLAAETVHGLSVRNRLVGQVRELVALSDRTFVAVDVGQFLWAEVTPEAVQELEIRPGKSIICLIKTTAIVVVT